MMCIYYLMLYIMSNVNTLNDTSVNQKKSSGLSRFSQVLALCTILSVANPTEMKANNITDDSLQNVEVVQNYNIINNIQRRTWVALPSIYTQKFNNFISNNRVLQNKNARTFTEDFIVNQMQFDRWINKQNQLLFIWDAIYEQITSKNIYTWEDGNKSRLSEFENVMDRVGQCGKDYKIWFHDYMEQRSADADKRSADADKRSTDADKRSIETTHKWLTELIRFYNFYKGNPSKVKVEDIREFKEHSKWIIQNCKKYWIDYKAKLSPEVRRFYDID